MRDPVVRAVEAVDELVIDGEGVVLLGDASGGRVVRLSALGLAVRSLTAGGMPLGALGVRLAAEFGVPEDGDLDGAVRTVVDDLAAQGVVEVDPGEGLA
ncbi:hypothetical protein OO014_10495 [Intrasporangium calvum]|uniref:Coenzyme PQQ synthesis D n=1 Tax=Intrasporangium calvum TaxID=53358 RepID=A0ABT5GHW3_9MICO|nr:hypothetical protein [Intrasporangium calvum]MDC5697689.1 hypothetical protein [Intrasporangium calvum]